MITAIYRVLENILGVITGFFRHLVGFLDLVSSVPSYVVSFFNIVPEFMMIFLAGLLTVAIINRFSDML